MVYEGVALKTRVAEILRSRVVREDGDTFFYLPTGTKYMRANVIGILTALDTEQQSGMLDDGTGQIRLQFFDINPNLAVGQLVMCIGRVREFGEPYLSADIVKPVDPGWAEVRNLELGKEDTPEEKSGNVLDIIRELDEGKGADEEEVLSKIGDEKQLRNLVRDGEIFYTAPGRLKVLD